MSENEEITIKYGAFERHFTLTADENQALGLKDPYVYLGGPCGTGKTTVLMLKGLEWMKAGEDVIVFSNHVHSITTSRLIYLQLSEARERSQGPLFPKDRTWGFVKYEYIKLVDVQSMDESLRTLQNHGHRELNIIMDNLRPDGQMTVQLELLFIQQLKARIPGLKLWIADFLSKIPDGFKISLLKEPLRYPIILLPEISLAVETMKAAEMIPSCLGYSSSPLIDLGPDVIHIRHKMTGQTDKWPIDSEECGRKVAKILTKLGVGSGAGGGAKGGKNGRATEDYQYRDVLVVCRNLVDKNTPSAFVRGLRASGIPTKVVGDSPFQRVEEVFDETILANEDKVTVANFAEVIGLDRKVVVCLTGVLEGIERWQLSEEEEREVMQGGKVTLTLTEPLAPGVESTLTITGHPTADQRKEEMAAREHRYKAEMELKHRLMIWSRCSHQLVVVHLPKGVEGGPSGSENYGRKSGKCVVL